LLRVPADGEGDGPRRRRGATVADLQQTVVVAAETFEPGDRDVASAVALTLLFIRCVHTRTHTSVSDGSGRATGTHRKWPCGRRSLTVTPTTCHIAYR